MNPPDISHLIDKSDPGAWANALRYGVHIKVSKYQPTDNKDAKPEEKK